MWKERLRTPEDFFLRNPPSTDLDGVLIDSRTPVVREFNRIFGTSHKTSDMHGWHQIARWAIEQGMDERSAFKLDEQLWYHRPDLLFEAELTPGALSFVNWFLDRGISLPAITSRPPHLAEVTHAWFEERLPQFPKKDIYINQDESLDDQIFKVLMIQVLGRRIHFEDSIGQTKLILNYTDALVVLLSNSIVLDLDSGVYKNRVLRFGGRDGQLPDLVDVNRALLRPH
jgi:hypothetical protein